LPGGYGTIWVKARPWRRRLPEKEGDVPMKKILESKNTKIVLAAVMLVSLLITIIAVTLPITRRAEKIDSLGGSALSTGESIAISVGHYSGAQIRALRGNPQENTTYADLCALLAKLKGHYDLKGLYAVNKGLGGAYFTLLDADYRDNGVAGTDYQGIGEPFEAAARSKEFKNMLDKIESGTIPGGYTKNMIREGSSGYIIVALPVYDREGALATTLCMDVALDNVEFNRFYFIDLNYVAGFFGGLFVLSLLMLVWIYRRGAREKKRRLEEEEE